MRISFLAAAALAAFAQQAHAASTINLDGSITIEEGSALDFSVDFVGFGGDPTTTLPTLSGRLDLSYLPLLSSATSYVFEFDLYNTSSATSQLTVFGFRIDPEASDAASTGLFDVAVDNPNGTIPDGFGSVDVCVKDAGNQNNCNSGMGNTGLAKGASTLNGQLTLSFANSGTNRLDMRDFFVRYQGISIAHPTTGAVITSAIGTGTVTMVPEPATWAMMIGGFGLAGAAMRRRRSSMATVTA